MPQAGRWAPADDEGGGARQTAIHAKRNPSDCMSGSTLASDLKRVLVVEDDLAIAGLLTRSLEAEGYETAAVHDGEAGLIKCVEFRPHVLLLDVNLPKLDGFSVAKRLKTVDALKNIPIIFLTAKDRPTDMIQGIQAGAKHYLTKPFKLEELLLKVHKLAG